MNYYDDTEFEEVTIAKVEREGDGGWAIVRSDGWSFFVPPESPVTPAVGMTARFYGRGIGYTVRGLFIGGEKVFYRTAQEEKEKCRKGAEAETAKRADELEKNRAEMDRQFAALPKAFQDRIATFRANNPNFRRDYEPYELFCCEQAVLIAKALDKGDVDKNEIAFAVFRAMSFDEQKERVPGLDDGHSGNTFDCATEMARQYLARPENVTRMHGALAPLVGSVAYGEVSC